MTQAPGPDRWAAAFSLLAWIERRSDAPSTRRKGYYRVDGHHAVRDSIRPEDLTPPVSGIARQVPEGAPRMIARCRADVVRLGQFDVDEVVRFRAFHGVGDAADALRVQAHGDPGNPGVQRAVGARIEVARHAPALAAPLYDHGVFPRRRVAYLREGIVIGRHPRNEEEMQSLVLPPLLEGMAMLYEGVGVTSQPLSSLVSAQLLERWDAVAVEGGFPPEVSAGARSLVRRDDHLPVSLGHGDLVRTNALITGDRVVLVDWEHARSMPIAFDLAKPVFLSKDPVAAIDLLRDQLGRILTGPSGSYTLEEQVALSLIQMLSWSAHRRRRAETAGRSDLLALDTARRLALLERLLG